MKVKTGVLFVCMGNICRSPVGEGVMRAMVEKAGLSDRVEVASAGTIGLHAGSLPDARMRAAASRRGYELGSRARQITREDLDRYDFILTMDGSNHRDVLALATTNAQRSRVWPFVGFCSKHKDTSVPDPYYGGDEGFERALDLIEDGCAGLLRSLVKKTRGSP
jgi:protein-tyrosine phosphatase